LRGYRGECRHFLLPPLLLLTPDLLGFLCFVARCLLLLLLLMESPLFFTERRRGRDPLIVILSQWYRERQTNQEEGKVTNKMHPAD